MLISFCMENIYSFNEAVTLDMTASAIKAHSYSLLEAGRYKLLPVAAIYGANASGKSNLVQGLEDLLSAISGGVFRSFGFALDGKGGMGQLCRSELHFFINLCSDGSKEDLVECKYTIQAIAYSNKYVKEELRCIPPAKKSLTRVFLREWDEAEGKWSLKIGTSPYVKTFSKEINYVSEMENSQEALLLTALGKRAQFPLFDKIYSWAVQGVSSYKEPYMTGNFGPNYIDEKNDLVAFINDEKTKDALYSFIRSINPLIQGISLVSAAEPTKIRTKNKDKDGYFLFFDYHISGEDNEFYRLLMSVKESKGVFTALHLFPKIFSILHNGGLLIVDELENSLHPLLMAKIVNLFTSPDTNPGKGQLIFTTHNVLLMDKKYFRQDEIIFVEKDNSTGSSSLYRLSDIDGVRSDLDFCKNYIYGAFGALPNLTENEENVPL